MSELTHRHVEAAAKIIGEAGLTTPSMHSAALSELSGASIHLKLENLQPTGSFKVRGALNKLDALTGAEKKRGVIAVSAGNHAQGVAYHARRMGIPACVVMPGNTPFVKVARSEALGARVVLEGEDLSQAEIAAKDLAAAEGFHFIHPYDDPRVIAGQGSIALEFLGAHPNLEILVVPVGGGGLAAGMAIAAKQMKPSIQILGVEAALFPSMHHALGGTAGQAGGQTDGQTLAEGIAVKQAGEITTPILRRLMDDLILVGEAELEQAMQIFLNLQRLVVEGAGAAPLAAVLGQRRRFANRAVGLVVSGGNVDSHLLSTVLMRGLVGEGRLVRLRIETSDEPGALARLTRMIGECRANIIEVQHQRLFLDVPVKSAEIVLVLETRDREHVAEIVAMLEKAGYPNWILSPAAGSPMLTNRR